MGGGNIVTDSLLIEILITVYFFGLGLLGFYFLLREWMTMKKEMERKDE